ncbi:MAG: HIT domain-containing protein [Alphaproteobacteria bacterium]
MHETLHKFGYPDTVIRDYEHWVVLLRPQQVTLGCMVLALKADVRTLGEVGPAAFAEMAAATRDIQTALGSTFGPQKINYLALMMVDPQVHFHVIPRYDGPRDLDGRPIDDPGWPKLPEMGRTLDLDPGALDRIKTKLAAAWP